MRDNETRRPAPQAEADGLIEGRNAVIEALRAGTAIDKIYLATGETDKTLGHIASRAREAGVVVVEAVFNWPGLGRLLVDAVVMRDYPVIQALVLLFSVEFILINLFVDVLYGFINPTIRYK